MSILQDNGNLKHQNLDTYSELFEKENNFEEIERHKENVQPLRKGRDLQKLKQALQISTLSKDNQLKIEFEEKHQQFENDIEKGQFSTNPLSHWLKYINWIESTYSLSSTILIPVLEKCTRAFQDCENYKNNYEYLNVWIKYANTMDNPADLYNFLIHKKIGIDYSYFYEYFSRVYENQGKYLTANQILKNGLKKMSIPIDRLRHYYVGFQNRCVIMINKEKEQIGQTTSNYSNENDENLTRKSLNVISNNFNRNISSCSQWGLGKSSISNQSTTKINSSHSNFSIFIDEECNQSVLNKHIENKPISGSLLTENNECKSKNIEWKNFIPPNVSHKENDNQVTTWNKPLKIKKKKNNIKTKNPINISVNKNSKFSIFVDAENVSNHNTENYNINVRKNSMNIKRRNI